VESKKNRNEPPRPQPKRPFPRFFLVRRLLCRGLGFVSVVLNVGFCRLSSMIRRMMKVAMRCVRVVGRLVVVPRVIVLRGLAMMPRRVLMVFGCFPVVFCCLFRHNVPQCEIWPGRCVFVRLRGQFTRWSHSGKVACAGPHENAEAQPMETETWHLWPGGNNQSYRYVSPVSIENLFASLSSPALPSPHASPPKGRSAISPPPVQEYLDSFLSYPLPFC
jgi:hypothetical protein